MKKYISLTLIVFLLTSLFTSCGTSETNIDFTDEVKLDFTIEDDDFLYELDGSIIFTVADNGDLYYISLQNADKSVIVLNLNGEKIKEEKIDDFNGRISSIAVLDGIFYFAHNTFKYNTAELSDIVDIYSYNFDTKKQDKIVSFNGFIDIKKIVPSGDKLHLFGKDIELVKNANYTSEHGYNGECVKSVDLKSGKIENVFEADKMPVMISETENGSVMLYAYDENDGYYFRELNSDKKIINNNTQLSYNFEMYGEQNIVYKYNQFINLLPMDNNGEVKEIFNGLPIYEDNNAFVSKSGCLFIKVENGIKRVTVNNLLINSTNLNIAYTNPYSQNMPRPDDVQKLNYNLDFKMVDYYDFSLSLLSQDSQYDLYHLNSWMDISDNIRRKGAFYPLNEVPFVKEYIDTCFPYVKEAAYDDNGNIWMIPISLQADALIYNELLCVENEIEVTSINSFEELFDTLIKVRDMDLKYQLQFDGKHFFEKYFYQTMQKNNGFNKDDFQKMSEYFYKYINFIKSDWTFYKIPGIGLNPEDLLIGGDSQFSNQLDHRGKKLLSFISIPDSTQQINNALKDEDYDDDEFWERLKNKSVFIGNSLNYTHNRYMMFPTIEGMTENDVTVTYLTINPNSKNLDVVLEYISKLCEYQLNLENSFILKDKSTYSDRHFVNDMYDILNYEGNYIRFSLDSELIYSDFEQYLGDEITLDEYLNRVEFKLNAYLNE